MKLVPLPPQPVASPRAGPQPLRSCTAVGLVEKLQTKEGLALLDGLVKDIAAFAVSENGLEDGRPIRLPGDQFERVIVKGVFHRHPRAGEVRSSALSAVAAQLVELAGRDGVVDVKKAQKALGPKGLQFFEALSRIDGKSGDPLADRRVMTALDSQTIAKLAGFESIAPKLGALDALVKQIARPDELKGFQLMGLQHLFATSASMFEALHDVGVEHEDMRLIGKVYSSNHRVVAELEHKGATVDSVSTRLGLQDFAGAMAASIEHQLKSIIETLPTPNIFTPEGRFFSEKPTPRVLLIDDGAEAIKILHEKFPDHAPFFVCVEQTRRGARILHDLEREGKLKCPVVNVAETWAKLEWESPMIGHSVALEVERKLDRLERAGVPPAKESLVIGCGAVGGGVARAMLARGMEVHLYDKDPARSAALLTTLLGEAEQRGFDATKIFVHTSKQEALQHAGVLISCVGARTLEREDHELLPDGAVLVNAASADDELGPHDLVPFRKGGDHFDDHGNIWTTFRGRAVNVGKGDAEAHSDTVLETPRTATGGGKQLYLVNNGYVVNMTGERDPIPARYIQLTRGLLFLGALTAKRASEEEGGGVGVHDVPMEWQRGLVNLVQRELRKTGEDLQEPSWETRPQDAWHPEDELTPPPWVVQRAADEARGLPPAPTERRLSESELAAANEAKEVAGLLAFRAPPAFGSENKLYGYRLGPAARGTFERAVAGLVDGSDTLSLEGAALHKACAALNKHHGVSLRASLKPMGEQTPMFTDKARVTFHEGKPIIEGGGPLSGAARFEELFGHFSRVLTGSLLAGRLQRAATEEEVGAELKKFLPSQTVDVTPWLMALARSTDEADRRLLKALRS